MIQSVREVVKMLLLDVDLVCGHLGPMLKWWQIRKNNAGEGEVERCKGETMLEYIQHGSARRWTKVASGQRQLKAWIGGWIYSAWGGCIGGKQDCRLYERCEIYRKIRFSHREDEVNFLLIVRWLLAWQDTSYWLNFTKFKK